MSQNIDKNSVPGKNDRKRPPQVKPPMEMKGIALMLMLTVLVLLMLKPSSPKVNKIDYSPAFVEYVKSGAISRCEIVRGANGNDHIIGKLTKVDLNAEKPEKFYVDVVITEDLLSMLQQNEVNFKITPPSSFWPVFLNVAPFILFFPDYLFLRVPADEKCRGTCYEFW